MDKQLAEYLINYSLDTGADFSEIFYENVEVNNIGLIDSRIDTTKTSICEGVGIRLALKDNIMYAHTNIVTKENLVNLIDKLKSNFNKKRSIKDVKLESISHETKIEKLSDTEKKETLYKVNEIARKESNLITEVSTTIYEEHQKVIVASSKGKYVTDERVYTRFGITVIANDGKSKELAGENYGFSTGSLFIKDINLESEIKDIVTSAINKLSAKHIKGGNMPVVLGPGFGAVIIHEACGHAMEATSVAKKLSVLTGKLGQKIASDKVTIIDDGTLLNEWGTTYYDDEGNKTKRNVLIDNGVLKSYLVDELNDRKMKHGITGSGRRQSYKFAPTSRMNNTYLEIGNDTFEDMVKSIENGLYAKKMGGGSVDPVTGDFNFVVTEGYIIKKGKICEPVKMATLIGNTLDILNNIEMVGNDLKHASGYCGSESGLIPNCVGQPTMKVSSILVGGQND